MKVHTGPSCPLISSTVFSKSAGPSAETRAARSRAPSWGRHCPTAQAYVATWAAGTPGHSWQVVSQGKSGLAHKGLIYAAKAMAGTAIDMIEDPSLIEAAKAEFLEDLDGDTYHCPIPDGCKPRAIGKKN